MLFAGVEPEERRERARDALEAVGLARRMDHRPDQLSGGERQRVAIARSVVMGPRLLLADEPTGNLDRASASEVMGLLERMSHNGRTLIVVTHDPAVADRAARIPRLIEQVGLHESAHKPLSTFSKGMLQRIGLAMALLPRPALVFLDEPTSGLDPFGRLLVRDVIRVASAEGTTVFLNSHLLSEV